MGRRVTIDREEKRRSRKRLVPSESSQRKMEDTELIKVAAFKLQESANRMRTLANEARSSRLRSRLLALSQELASHEHQLHELIGTHSTGGDDHRPTTTPGLRARGNKVAHLRRPTGSRDWIHARRRNRSRGGCAVPVDSAR